MAAMLLGWQQGLIRRQMKLPDEFTQNRHLCFDDQGERLAAIAHPHAGNSGKALLDRLGA